MPWWKKNWSAFTLFASVWPHLGTPPPNAGSQQGRDDEEFDVVLVKDEGPTRQGNSRKRQRNSASGNSPQSTAVVDLTKEREEAEPPQRKERRRGTGGASPNACSKVIRESEGSGPMPQCPVCWSPCTEPTVCGLLVALHYTVVQLNGRAGVTQATKCGHVFCGRCIRASLKEQKSCPTCRKKVAPQSLVRLYFS